MSEAYNEFLINQDQIFDKFRVATAEVGVTQGIERDPGIDPQAAFLIAWRYPSRTTDLIDEFSGEIADALASDGNPGALRYNAKNAHTTVSDYSLEKGLVIDPSRVDHEEVLDTLRQAVKRALDEGGASHHSDLAVDFTGHLTNGKTVIATGVPTETVWEINQRVLSSSQDLGIDLKGSWGSHMTDSRFTDSHPADSSKVQKLIQLIHETPAFGASQPESIDVGYFQTDPQNGFVFTPSERFELGS